MIMYYDPRSRLFQGNLMVTYTVYHTISTFNSAKEEDLENTLGKGENACNQHFLLFPHCFLLYQREKLSC